MIGLEHTWIITVKRHEEKYDQKKFKKFQKKSCEKKLSLTISEIAFSL